MMTWEVTWAFEDHPELQEYLDEGWEPFGVNREDIGRPYRIYLKRLTRKDGDGS